MFGLSTEMITKGKRLSLKRHHLNLFMVANLPLDINSVDKPNNQFWVTLRSKIMNTNCFKGHLGSSFKRSSSNIGDTYLTTY